MNIPTDVLENGYCSYGAGKNHPAPLVLRLQNEYNLDSIGGASRLRKAKEVLSPVQFGFSYSVK